MKNFSQETDLLVRGKLQITLGFISLKRKKQEIENVLEEQQSLLDAGVPYSIKYEIELNEALIQYANECIYLITRLQKCKLLGKLDFPLQHKLIRYWRDYNHHEAALEFKPMKSFSEGIKFYIWPILSNIPAIKKEYPHWCRQANGVELIELIQRNQEYMESLMKEASDNLPNVQLLFFPYQCGQVYFGKDRISNEESWHIV